MIIRLIGPVIAALLGLFVLSYVVGDNLLYRLALHIFVGAMIGYAGGIIVRDVLLGMALPGLLSNPVSVVIPLTLGLLLLFKGLPRQAFVGNVSVAFLIGVGAAVAMGGALLGTVVPQVQATARALGSASLNAQRFGLLDGLMVVCGTVCTLLAFTFTASEPGSDGALWQKVLGVTARIGRFILVFAFGVAFAGVLTAALSVFIGRMHAFFDLALRALGLGL